MNQPLRCVDSFPAISSPEEIIDEARNGRMFILVDDEARESQGDLIIPAQMATPDVVNFMATYGRGLVCLAICQSRADQLELGLMPRSNGTRHSSAFTVSIEAREGVTTGISAADRARTISVAIDATHGAEDLVSPGHVFPLVARPGGVLVRAGHTEAAVDVARLAGLNASGVICEIMNDDGSMARLDDLVGFARHHQLRIGTIRDLIAYRRRHDRNIVKLSEMQFVSHFGGEWRMLRFRNEAVGGETIALVKGHIEPGRPTLVRMHQLDLLADVLGETGYRGGILQGAMRAIETEGAGVIVILNRQIGELGEASASRLQQPGRPSSDPAELRDYGIGAEVLAELGVHDMILLSMTAHSPVGLAGYGLSIVEERPVAGFVPEPLPV